MNDMLHFDSLHDPNGAGLPVAGRDRWQPIRGGLLNIYLYDSEEFRYEQGRLLLRGNNGTGKTRVLALQLPFLLDGEVHSRRFEPDGDPSKRMEWNLLMGKHPDRLGYTWIEFGRRDDDGSFHYVTLGCGMNAVQGRGLVDKWFFVTQQRVGCDLFLQSEAGYPLPKDRLIEAVGEQGKVYESAREYRRAVDEALFKLGPLRYEALMNLLIQLRQPQLSRQLDEQKLSDALSEALPPISEAILADVAEAFRGLEKDRIELDDYRTASAGVGRFLEQYRRYTRIAARRRAGVVRSRHSDYESAQRKLRDEERSRDESDRRQRELTTREEQLERDEQSLTARIDVLRDDPRMRDAHAVDRAKQALDQLEQDVGAAADRVKRARQELQRCDEDHRDVEQKHEAAAKDAAAELRNGSQAAEAAGLEAFHRELSAILALDQLTDQASVADANERVQDLLQRRREAADHLESLNQTVQLAREDLRKAKETQTELAAQLDQAFEEQKDAVTRREQAEVDLLESYSVWCKSLSELYPPPPEEIADELSDWCDEATGPGPVQRAVRAAADSAQRTLAELRAESNRQLRESEARLNELTQHRDAFAAGLTERPPLPHTRDEQERSARDGAPLWALCDFAADVDERSRRGLEAALEAAGFLDAWVTPDGRMISSDQSETYLAIESSPRAAADRQVGRLLVPFVDPSLPLSATVPQEVVAQVLTYIGVGQDSGPAWVDVDGRWQNGPLHGRWSKAAAQYIGPQARERNRQQRLTELESEIGRTESNLEQIRHELSGLDDRLRMEESEVRDAPDESPVRIAVADIASAAKRLNAVRLRVAEADEYVAGRNQSLAAATEQRNVAARDLDLEVWIERLAELRQALSSYEVSWGRIQSRLERLIDLTDQLAKAGERARSARLNADEAERHWRDVNSRHEGAKSTFETLQATVGAQVEKILSQLDSARSDLDDVLAEKKRVAGELVDARVAIETANVNVNRLKEDIERHAADRESAVHDLRRMSECGLLSIAVPQVDMAEKERLSPSRAVEIARLIEASLKDVDDDQSAWERMQKNVHASIQDLIAALPDYRPAVELQDELLIVTATFHGRESDMAELADALADEIAHREQILTEREREVLENHLVDEVAAHLHERIHEAEHVVRKMSDEVSKRPMSTGMKLRFHWRLSNQDDPGLKEARQRLLGTSGTWSPTDRQALGEFLQRRIQDARSGDEGGTWHQHLSQSLDYRRWHRMEVERFQDERWVPLTRRTHGTGSGGEKTIALIIPQFAAAAAHYSSAYRLAPRIVLLDEAFAGVDPDMRRKCLGLLHEFDLDFVMTSELEWGCYPTVPGLAIYHLTRREGVDAVHATRWVWNGRQRIRDNGRPGFSVRSAERRPQLTAPAIDGNEPQDRVTP